ncbi:MAG: hypothetical protein GKS06_11510 [Acidobacteria bacterium]|nr:hypothetical protein [Acidobacteriota bacterium]
MWTRRNDSKGSPVAMCAGLAALTAVLFWFDSRPIAANAREQLQVRTAPTQAFGSGATVSALRQLGRIHPHPFDLSVDVNSLAAAGPDGRRQVEAYALDPEVPAELPSSASLPADVWTNAEVDVLSLTLRDRAAAALLAEPDQRGLASERPGYVTLVRGGRIAFATGVGVRIHGGTSRVRSENKSFRIYFREIYGEDGMPAELVFDDGPRDPLREIIAHNDVRTDPTGQAYRFVNAMAYAVAERLGSLVPRLRPVRFFLNGEFKGVYFVTERLGPDYLAARFSHANFTAARTRRDNFSGWFEGGDRDAYDAFVGQYVTDRSQPDCTLNARRAERDVDLDNLTNWFVGVLFNGTTDWYQGLIARDEAAEGPWFWVNWDLDHSFTTRRIGGSTPWARDMFRLVLNRGIRPRSVILSRLINGDPEYRERLARRLVDALNHELTEEFLRDLVGQYRRIADTYGIEDQVFLDRIETFFEHRPDVILRQAAEHLGYGAPASVVVKMSDGGAGTVDGHAFVERAELRYLRGMQLEIRVPRAAGRRLSAWRIDGREQAASGARLTVTVEADTTIEAILEGRDAARR